MKFLEKSRGIGVDCIAYDLEDSVTPSKKAEARNNLRSILSRDRASNIKEQAVRINSVDSGYALDDLTEVVRAHLWVTGLSVPTDVRPAESPKH